MTGPGCGWSKISRVRAPYDNLDPAVKPLQSPESAVYIMDSLLDPLLRDRGHLSRLVAWRKEASPASHDILIRPALGHVRIESHQQVQVIVQDREPREGHREDFRKFLEPMLDPAFPVVHPFPEQEGPPHAARHTVKPAGHGRINQMGTRNRHGRISWDHPHKLPNPTR